MKTTKNTASELGDPLRDAIQQFAPPAPLPQLPTRLRHAIERVRWHLCGLFGVKAPTVTDAHVAAFVEKVKVDYVFRQIPGLGYQTEEALMKWAREEARRTP